MFIYFLLCVSSIRKCLLLPREISALVAMIGVIHVFALSMHFISLLLAFVCLSAYFFKFFLLQISCLDLIFDFFFWFLVVLKTG